MRHLQGLLDGNHSGVLAIGTNQADFRNADTFIYSKFVCAYVFLLCI